MPEKVAQHFLFLGKTTTTTTTTTKIIIIMMKTVGKNQVALKVNLEGQVARTFYVFFFFPNISYLIWVLEGNRDSSLPTSLPSSPWTKVSIITFALPRSFTTSFHFVNLIKSMSSLISNASEIRGDKCDAWTWFRSLF